MRAPAWQARVQRLVSQGSVDCLVGWLESKAVRCKRVLAQCQFTVQTMHVHRACTSTCVCTNSNAPTIRNRSPTHPLFCSCGPVSLFTWAQVVYDLLVKDDTSGEWRISYGGAYKPQLFDASRLGMSTETGRLYYPHKLVDHALVASPLARLTVLYCSASIWRLACLSMA